MPGSSSATAMRTSSLGIGHRPGGPCRHVVERLPGCPVQRQGRRRPRARRAARRACASDTARHAPAGVGIDTDRHLRHPRRGPSLSLGERVRQDPSVPVTAGAGTGRRGHGFPDAPPQGVGQAAQVARRRRGRARARSARSSAGSVRLWLVSTAMAIRSAGQPAHDRARARGSGRSGRAPDRPATGTPWTPRPYGIAGLSRAVRAMSSTIAARDAVARGRRPPYSAAAQRARSLAERGDRAGAAGGGDDRGERHDLRPVRQVDRGQLRGPCRRSGSRARPGPLGASADWYAGVVEPERREEPRRAAGRPSGARPTASASMPEDQVVRVRVVPRRARAWRTACRRSRASAPRPRPAPRLASSALSMRGLKKKSRSPLVWSSSWRTVIAGSIRRVGRYGRAGVSRSSRPSSTSAHDQRGGERLRHARHGERGVGGDRALGRHVGQPGSAAPHRAVGEDDRGRDARDRRRSTRSRSSRASSAATRAGVADGGADGRCAAARAETGQARRRRRRRRSGPATGPLRLPTGDGLGDGSGVVVGAAAGTVTATGTAWTAVGGPARLPATDRLAIARAMRRRITRRCTRAADGVMCPAP